MLTERLFDISVLVLAGVAMLIFRYEIVSKFLMTNIYEGLLQKLESKDFLWLTASGALILFLVCTFLMVAFRGRFKRKLIRIYLSLIKGLTSFRQLKLKARFLFYSIAIWMFYLLSIFAGFLSLESTSTLGLNAAFTAMVFSGLAMAAPVQGGIDIFHWMMAKCLLLYRVAFGDGLAYATIIYVAQLIPIVIFISVGLLVFLEANL